RYHFSWSRARAVFAAGGRETVGGRRARQYRRTWRRGVRGAGGGTAGVGGGKAGPAHATLPLEIFQASSPFPRQSGMGNRPPHPTPPLGIGNRESVLSGYKSKSG